MLGRVTSVVAIAAAVAGCATTDTARPATATVGTATIAQGIVETPADRALADLLNEQLLASWEANPVGASTRGQRAYDRDLPDVTPEAQRRRIAMAQKRLDQLDAIDRSALSPSKRVTAELLERSLREQITLGRFETWRAPITGMRGPQITLPQIPDQLSLTTDETLEAYLARLEGVPAYLAAIEANMRLGMAEGWTPPRITMGSVASQARAQGSDQPVRAHAMYAPFLDRTADDPLALRAQMAIRGDVMPAFDGLAVFLEEMYVPSCRSTIAAAALPDGPAYYASEIKRYTTHDDLDASEIHALGRIEVARIRGEMMELIRSRSAFDEADSMDDDELFAAFTEWLRTDPRFYYDEPDDLIEGYRTIAKRIDGELPALFKRLPRLPYGVREMPEYQAVSAPTAYYYPGSFENGRAGYFVANTHRLDMRPTYEMIPLTLHEAAPGHHTQYSLARESAAEGLHAWRGEQSYMAYGEGWALYAERLGLELGDGEWGLYENPYDDFGRLSFEMWRALRLVVDTGIHAMGWTREEAIEYMLANSALTRANVEREVDRYIAWPAQALAYKIGELHIRELRARAEAILGDDFDIREFHEVVLGAGSVPLGVLTEQVEGWIRSERGEPTGSRSDAGWQLRSGRRGMGRGW